MPGSLECHAFKLKLLLINRKTACCLINSCLSVPGNPACENSVGLCWPSVCLSLQHNTSALRGGTGDASFFSRAESVFSLAAAEHFVPLSVRVNLFLRYTGLEFTKDTLKVLVGKGSDLSPGHHTRHVHALCRDM